MSTIAQHAATSYYITYLKEVTIWRLHNPGLPFKDAPPLQLQTQESSPIYPFITENKLTAQETIVLLLALAPHLQPNLLIETVAQAFPQGVDFPLFGGVKGKNHRGIIPTGETAQFIIGGTNIEKRLQVHQYFTEAHPFQKKQQLYLEAVPEGGP
ncbi:MAG: ATP-binding protein, partial [Marinirhabdus sp.]